MADRKPDAIRSPLSFAGAGGSHARLARLQSEFAPVLQAPHVFVRHQGTEHFITADPRDTLLFPSLGPRSGEARYDWEDRGDGIFYGYLKPDA
jgi:hypothetical protein